jgi:hypothetical protein
LFENRVLRRTAGPKRDEAIIGWRQLQNEELHNLYSSPNIIRMDQVKGDGMAGDIPRIGGKRNTYRVLVGKPEGKRPVVDQVIGGRII